MEIIFDDAVPKMGNGRRRVVAEIGRKKVVLYNPFTKKRKAIKMAQYEELGAKILGDNPKEILGLIPRDCFTRLRRLLNEKIRTPG